MLLRAAGAPLVYSGNLVPPGLAPSLAEFKARFDDYQRETHETALAVEAFRWLAGLSAKGEARPVLVYEHPSRRDARSMDNAEDMRAWRGINDIMIGFAGAPGHQGMRAVGAYEHQLTTIDRWDPVAATIGDAWDTLLGEGLDVWAAYAPSDHHNEREDYWPCQISETWVQRPSAPRRACSAHCGPAASGPATAAWCAASPSRSPWMAWRAPRRRATP